MTIVKIKEGQNNETFYDNHLNKVIASGCVSFLSQAVILLCDWFLFNVFNLI